MDPLAVVFIPGGLTAAALICGLPAALIAHIAWRRRAPRRLARHTCGHCGRAWLPQGDQFLVTGIRVCEPCALIFRRRLRLGLPLLATTTSMFAVTSATAFIVSLVPDRPSLAWWLDGRWIPLLLPSVGIVIVTTIMIKVAKLSNRNAAAASISALHHSTQAERVT